MTVAELIERLRQMDGDLPVWIGGIDNAGYTDLIRVSWNDSSCTIEEWREIYREVNTYCLDCDFDRHICNGCGSPMKHGQLHCEQCADVLRSAHE